MSEVIKSISYNQHEILYNIMQLHNEGKPYECDVTYSKGGFYGYHQYDGMLYYIPSPSLKFDVCPQTVDTQKLEVMGKFPMEDNSIHSIVIDLPFVVAPKTANSVANDDGKKRRNIMHKRFSSFYPVKEMLDTYAHFIREAYRVLDEGGICVFKTQNNVSGGKFICTEEFSWLEACKSGFHILDRFTLLAKSRLISGKIKKQQHARNFSSTFWVLKKDTKHKTFEYFYN
jgi:hypothetical protein